MTRYEYIISRRDNARLEEQAAREDDFYAVAECWRDFSELWDRRAKALTLEEAGEPAEEEI
jgi:hypothetical protein